MASAAAAFTIGWLTPGKGALEREEAECLLSAARRGRATEVTDAVESGVAVDAAGEHGETALILAAANGHLGVVELLCSLDAAVTAHVHSNFPAAALCHGGGAVHAAAAFGHVKILEALLAATGSFLVRDGTGSTPAHVAASAGHTEVLEFLLARGAPVDEKNCYGCTPLALAASAGRTDGLEGGTVALLLAHGASVDTTDNESNTPLHRAAAYGHVQAAALLLEAGAACWSLNAQGVSPIEFSGEVRSVLRDHMRKREALGLPEAGMAQAARARVEVMLLDSRHTCPR